MDKEIKQLIRLNLIREIQIGILLEKEQGQIISEEIINNILQSLEKPE